MSVPCLGESHKSYGRTQLFCGPCSRSFRQDSADTLSEPLWMPFPPAVSLGRVFALLAGAFLPPGAVLLSGPIPPPDAVLLLGAAVRGAAIRSAAVPAVPCYLTPHSYASVSCRPRSSAQKALVNLAAPVEVQHAFDSFGRRTENRFRLRGRASDG
jgi:hypothetical protein